MANHRNDPYQLIQLSPGRARKLLVFNAGSQSLRYDWFDTAKAETRLSGRIDSIGMLARHSVRGPGIELDEKVKVKDPQRAIDVALDMVKNAGLMGADGDGIDAVGHRVLYSGDTPGSAAEVDDALVQTLSKAGFEPWRQTQRLLALAHCRERMSKVPHFAVFDSAFFQTMPDVAQVYGIPYRYYKQFGLRRLGFQGLSHKYAGMRSAMFLHKPFDSMDMIGIHLGNGASLSSIDHGRATDTSMGLTPLSGPLQGQRCGDLDPGLLLHLAELEGSDPDQLALLLNDRSGLLGISGLTNDMRELKAAANRGDQRALLAIEVYCHQVRRWAGSMAVGLERVDVMFFTGGVGENAAGVRARICQGLGQLGVQLDDQLNNEGLGDEDVVEISRANAPVKVLVVRSDEARMIARETIRAMDRCSLNKQVHAAKDTIIPIGVSAHHVHLTQQHVEELFGPGYKLTPKVPLKQPGQFASEERVDLIGPRGEVKRVRVLGPVRSATQVEISKTEEFQLGIDAPVRNSGDLDGTPGVVLRGPKGTVEIEQGVICARRHIHMSLDDAVNFKVKNKDVVTVEVNGDRPLIFGDVLIRAKDTYVLEMHIDTDEANAGEIVTGMTGRLVSIQSRPSMQ